MIRARHVPASALLLAPLLAAGCRTAPVSVPGLLVAAHVAEMPRLDGDPSDPQWAEAAPLSVPMTGGTGPHEVTLRAIVRGDDVFLLAEWADATHDVEHKVWTPKAGAAHVAGPEREDVIAVAFPISGEFTGDMLSPVECVWDVWQWKSARTDPAGYAMDKSHVHTFADPGGKRHEHKFDDGRALYIRRPEDAGTSATRAVKAPASGGDRVHQFFAQTPAGSAADVRAKGVWRDGRWTVEFARRLTTGHADDADLGGATTVPFAVAILDRGEDEDHSATHVLTLRLTR